jgi:hypothetical protein
MVLDRNGFGIGIGIGICEIGFHPISFTYLFLHDRFYSTGMYCRKIL